MVFISSPWLISVPCIREIRFPRPPVEKYGKLQSSVEAAVIDLTGNCLSKSPSRSHQAACANCEALIGSHLMLTKIWMPRCESAAATKPRLHELPPFTLRLECLFEPGVVTMAYHALEALYDDLVGIRAGRHRSSIHRARPEICRSDGESPLGTERCRAYR